MRIVSNAPGDRPFDILSEALSHPSKLSAASQDLTIGGVGSILELPGAPLALSLLISSEFEPYGRLFGPPQERRARNALRARAQARSLKSAAV